MDKENVAKGDVFYMNNNDRKNADNHPDFVGKLMINQEQLRALIEIHERARELAGKARARMMESLMSIVGTRSTLALAKIQARSLLQRQLARTKTGYDSLPHSSIES